MTADQMAFPEFQFQLAAARLDAATETTIREIHRMSAIHKILSNRENLWNRVIHERHGVARGHRMIRRLTRRMIHEIPVIRVIHKILLNHVIPLNHKILLNHVIPLIHKIPLIHVILLIHWTQKSGVLFVSHKIREIRSNRGRLLNRKRQLIHQNCHTIRKNRWTGGQLQTDHQKQSFQPKHPNKPNEQIS